MEASLSTRPNCSASSRRKGPSNLDRLFFAQRPFQRSRQGTAGHGEGTPRLSRAQQGPTPCLGRRKRSSIEGERLLNTGGPELFRAKL